jgi:dCMP deaminase
LYDRSERRLLMANWDARWLQVADHIATWSKDRSTQVGCVIVGNANQVLSMGYNGFPRGVNDDIEERHDRPDKYLWTEHAERNAIYNAARTGMALAGSTMYLPWYPCADCARAIIQSGISTLVATAPVLGANPQWDHDFEVSKEMLLEGKVVVVL